MGGQRGNRRDLRVLGVEEILKYPMLDGAVTLIGKLDLRVLKITDNMRLVLDFKTAAVSTSTTTRRS